MLSHIFRFVNTFDKTVNALTFVIHQEEMDRPEVQVPRAMFGALTIGLGTAFCVLITLLFCITDFDEVGFNDCIVGTEVDNDTG